MALYHWFTGGLLMASAPLSAQSQQLEFEATPTKSIDQHTIDDEIAIKTSSDERMTVPVSVSGAGPYNFLVDTGSERTVISQELASKLGLASGRSTLLHSVMGTKNINTVHIPNLRVSKQVMSVADAPALVAADIGADGMLGVDSLQSQRVLFDFKANTMSIAPATDPIAKTDGSTIVVRARSRNGRLIFTQAKVEGRKVTVIIDTGSQVTIGNPALRKMLAKRGLYDASTSINISSVTGEKMEAEVAMLKELEIGGIKLGDLAIAYADAHIFRQMALEDKPALLLGMNAMRAFDRVSIDFANRKVRFVLPGTSMVRPARMAARTS
jgi:predicted aspartyl protease